MNQLATKIKELPVEMISEILKHMELRFYVTIFIDSDYDDERIFETIWFDKIEDALTMFFIHCKKAYYCRSKDDYSFTFGTNKVIYNNNSSFYPYTIEEIIEKILEINKIFPFDIQIISDQLKLNDHNYYNFKYFYL